MKAKNQQPYTSESEAKEKLIVYVYEYLIHSGAKQAADTFKENIGYSKDIKVNEGPGFLADWWCVFWDLYCAAPERRHTQPESSSDARAFHDFMRSAPMSPSITQTSPPQHIQQQQQQQPPPPLQFIAGPRYGPPPGQPRGPPPPRMQGPPPMPPQQQQQQHGPHPGGQPGGFMPAGSPRYAHGPPPPQPPPQHMSQGGGPMFGHGPADQMGSSPGLNRMTPVGAPPPPPPQQQQQQQQQVVGPPPPPQMVGMGGGPGQQQMGGGPPHSDEYVMPVPFGQEPNDQCESAEILKLKQSMQEDTTRMFETEQSEFSLNDYSDSQNI